MSSGEYRRVTQEAEIAALKATTAELYVVLRAILGELTDIGQKLERLEKVRGDILALLARPR